MPLSPEARADLQQRYSTITKAADIIRKPGTWCRYARRQATKQGYAYCAMGALDAMVPGVGHMGTHQVTKDLDSHLPPLNISPTGENAPCERVVYFNNTNPGGHAAVVDLFDRTAASLKCALDNDGEDNGSVR